MTVATLAFKYLPQTICTKDFFESSALQSLQEMAAARVPYTPAHRRKIVSLLVKHFEETGETLVFKGEVLGERIAMTRHSDPNWDHGPN